MEIIPVLDLKGGAVVHAKHGQRESYQPIVSRLCATSIPDELLAGLLRLHSFQTIYIADLDAIEQKGEHSRLIAELARSHPAMAFWVDSGTSGYTDCKNIQHVLGSESIDRNGSLQAIDRAKMPQAASAAATISRCCATPVWPASLSLRHYMTDGSRPPTFRSSVSEPHEAAANGCFAVLYFCCTSAAFGVPFTARSIDSFVAL
jgi:hypothetical protein